MNWYNNIDLLLGDGKGLYSFESTDHLNYQFGDLLVDLNPGPMHELIYLYLKKDTIQLVATPSDFYKSCLGTWLQRIDGKWIDVPEEDILKE